MDRTVSALAGLPRLPRADAHRASPTHPARWPRDHRDRPPHAAASLATCDTTRPAVNRCAACRSSVVHSVAETSKHSVARMLQRSRLHESKLKPKVFTTRRLARPCLVTRGRTFGEGPKNLENGSQVVHVGYLSESACPNPGKVPVLILGKMPVLIPSLSRESACPNTVS